MVSYQSKSISFKDLKYRINPKPYPIKRYSTGIKTFDDWVGKLPYGLTVIYGEAGCGKSLLSREIAKKAEHCLYFTCEVTTDAPPHKQFNNVDTIDYTRYRVNYKRALEELDCFITELKPTLVIIDSLTSFLSITKKALPESDLRSSISQIHTKYEGKIPIIGISEIRGTGYNVSTSGGEGVKHSNSMLIQMSHTFIDYPSMVEQYNMEMGDDLYLLRVEKDKHNLANRKRARVILTEDNNITIRDLKKKKKSAWTGI